MAAGQAERFGSCKSLALLNGKPFLQHVIDAVTPIANNQIFAVTGRYHEEIKKQFPKLSLIENKQWQQGLGSSISRGAKALSDEYENLLIVLADQVAIKTDDIKALMESHQPNQITCAFYSEKCGVPAIFSKSYFSQLLELNSDQGAKALLSNSENNVVTISMKRAALDIDTLDQLQRYLSSN
ncbi:nucleotidyltransferase family protein [Porticoccaceae bacterium LTM1]|nr:nucleotidyltransferase family protein [Porticoccaceae bacterium LTM1]